MTTREEIGLSEPMPGDAITLLLKEGEDYCGLKGTCVDTEWNYIEISVRIPVREIEQVLRHRKEGKA